jgi:hypothetical protein
MKLKDLLRIAFNAGVDDEDGFDSWWRNEGEERQDEFLDEQAADDDGDDD